MAALRGDPPGLDLVANLGVNGYTSGDLVRVELPALELLAPEFATVLIGVNDVVQGVAPAVYEANVETILDGLLARLAAARIMARQSQQRGIAFVDIVDLSLLAATDRSLVAGDGLHPSGAQYVLWVERIAPTVAALFSGPSA